MATPKWDVMRENRMLTSKIKLKIGLKTEMKIRLTVKKPLSAQHLKHHTTSWTQSTIRRDNRWQHKNPPPISPFAPAFVPLFHCDWDCDWTIQRRDRQSNSWFKLKISSCDNHYKITDGTKQTNRKVNNGTWSMKFEIRNSHSYSLLHCCCSKQNSSHSSLRQHS